MNWERKVSLDINAELKLNSFILFPGKAEGKDAAQSCFPSVPPWEAEKDQVQPQAQEGRVGRAKEDLGWEKTWHDSGLQDTHCSQLYIFVPVRKKHCQFVNKTLMVKILPSSPLLISHSPPLKRCEIRPRLCNGKKWDLSAFPSRERPEMGLNLHLERLFWQKVFPPGATTAPTWKILGSKKSITMGFCSSG